MDDKIKQLDLRIQSMLAPLHYYTTTPAPMSANCVRNFMKIVFRFRLRSKSDSDTMLPDSNSD